jgi:proline dehydrogenase
MVLSRMVARSLPYLPRGMVARVARRYIAGDDLAAARQVAEDLVRAGFHATLDVLGEDVGHPAEGDRSLQDYLDLARAIPTWQGGAERLSVSLKLTQFGLRFEPEACADRLDRLAEECASRGVFLRLDMEGSATTDRILGLYRAIQANHPGGVGCVLQAMLFRTRLDAGGMAGSPHHDVRLCKGIYREPPEIAWQDYQGVRENFVEVARVLLAGGVRTRLATHDDWLIRALRELVRELGIGPGQVEFQALLGVPILKTLAELRDAGHPVRLYVPYGRAWYAYSLRRLRENPAVAGHVMRSLWSRQR